MALIDDTYFIRKLTIGQLGENTVQQKLAMYISQYEEDFLNKVLGYGFAKLMMANMTQPRFIALITGSEYSYKGVLHKWLGFTNVNKISPIANYVFYNYVRESVDVPVGLGTVRPKAENSSVIVPTLQLIEAFNEMVHLIKNMNYFLFSNASTYPEYKENETHRFETINAYF